MGINEAVNWIIGQMKDNPKIRGFAIMGDSLTVYAEPDVNLPDTIEGVKINISRITNTYFKLK
jgi:hypothetical protein